jgi:hypothetical protein
VYRQFKFPRLAPLIENNIPQGSSYWLGAKSQKEPTEIREVVAEQWLESEWGKRLPQLYEQVLFQQTHTRRRGSPILR